MRVTGSGSNSDAYRRNEINRRLERLEKRDDEHYEEFSQVWKAITRLQVKSEDADTRHANAPAWVGIVVSAVTALVVGVLGLVAAGVRP